MPCQKKRRLDTVGVHPRLHLDDPAASFRRPSSHYFKDHIGQDAINIYPFDPAFAVQQDNGHDETSIEFTGSDISDKLKPVFALQVCIPAGDQGTCLDSGTNKPLVDTLPLR